MKHVHITISEVEVVNGRRNYGNLIATLNSN